MQAALRPMNLGEILDRTFEIYRKNFLLFAGIAALPATLVLAIHLADIGWVHTDRWFGPANQDQGTRIAAGWFLAYGYYHISGFLGTLFLPAFVSAVSRNLFNERNSILGSLRTLGARWRTYLWLAFLKICAQLVVPEGLTIGMLFVSAWIFIKLGMRGDGAQFAVLMFALIAALATAFYWIGACLAFAFPAATLEEMSAWKGLKRSRKLTRGTRGRIFVAFIMAIACALVLHGLVALLAWWIATLFYRGHTSSGYNQQLYAFVVHFFYAMVGTVVGPLYPIAVTLLYYDQRSRKEGFDVELMMNAAGLMTPAATVSADAANLPPPARPVEASRK